MSAVQTVVTLLPHVTCYRFLDVILRGI